MACCEKCWNDSYSETEDHSDAYQKLVRHRTSIGQICTPKEQAGQWWDEEKQCDTRENGETLDDWKLLSVALKRQVLTLQSQLAVAKEALEFVEGRMKHSCNIEYGNSVGMENCKLCRVRAALEKFSSCAW